MIYIETKMKSIPSKCTLCRYTAWEGTGRASYKICSITKKPLEAVFVKEKRNYSYIRPEWCPLFEVKERIK